jgi:molybdopterin molybdotransferase
MAETLSNNLSTWSSVFFLDDTAMLTVAEAKRLVEAHRPPRRIERVPIERAVGRILAEPIVARQHSPLFTNSAMDGVVLRYSELASGRRTWQLAGESRAGVSFEGVVEQGEAVRINTGAMLPQELDTVVPIEDMSIENGSERGEGDIATLANEEVVARIRPGQFVRSVGDEYLPGDVLVDAGKRINAAVIALLAQLGAGDVAVFARPRVAIFTTGSELVPHTATPAKGQIRDSNNIMLTAAVEESGGEVALVNMVDDSYEATRSLLMNILAMAETDDVEAGVDIILSTGGASVGQHDFIKPVAHELGFETVFWRVKQRPGKPLFFATRPVHTAAAVGSVNDALNIPLQPRSTLLFGLPGNPVSVLMCYVQYVHPMLRWLRGEEFEWQRVEARLSQALLNTQPRADFVRVRLVEAPDGVLEAVPLAKQESYMLTSVTGADGFVFLDVDVGLREGAMVEVLLF